LEFVIKRSLPEIEILISGSPGFKRSLVETDYKWRIEDLTDSGVMLHCLYTGHTITLGADNVREYWGRRTSCS
jgi:hypothetical protein